MSEQGWQTFLAAEGVEDWVVLHGGAATVFRAPSLGEAAQLAEAVARNCTGVGPAAASVTLRLDRAPSPSSA